MPEGFVAQFKNQSRNRLAERIASEEIDSRPDIGTPRDAAMSQPKAKQREKQINFRVTEEVFYEWSDAMRYLGKNATEILETFVEKWLGEHRSELDSALRRRGSHRG